MTTEQLTALPHTTSEEHDNFIRVTTEEGYLFHSTSTYEEPSDPSNPEGEKTLRTTHGYATSIAAPKGCTSLIDYDVVPESERIENTAPYAAEA